jgi:hypothetical protein
VTVAAATLNGHAATAVRVQVPSWGVWWADVDLAEPEALTGAATLVLADKTLVGTILAGGAANGRAGYRIAGGAGGWGREIPAKPYRNDATVKIANVIGDAAAAVGETVADVPTTRVGPHYARALGPASAVLHLLTPRAWRVDFDGVTRFGARSTVAYTGEGARSRVDPQAQVVEIAADEIGTLIPGVTIDGSAPATDVEYVLDAKRLTIRVYAGTGKARRLTALAKILDALMPSLRYRGVSEFRVVTKTGERLNLQPVRVATGLSDLSGVPVRPGVAGLKTEIPLGSLVLVAFVDADPSRPCVISHDAPDAPGFTGLDGIVKPIARQGDPIVGGGGGTIGPHLATPTKISSI